MSCQSSTHSQRRLIHLSTSHIRTVSSQDADTTCLPPTLIPTLRPLSLCPVNAPLLVLCPLRIRRSRCSVCMSRYQKMDHRFIKPGDDMQNENRTLSGLYCRPDVDVPAKPFALSLYSL
ncbi:unnamed protein product [Chondrus crispus]|uniref:Uncharacterized protein n=1 Tax=Chondrus crispus TaxID=2769 RepID=R7Q750_CHOCR|nr:unnamed protein product [Chondrus crispus]CDF33648.1 unnamed protein product [Chondrus crispus]|eukprot:XP_005713467.1 unnamed protein product [Chondrus crispus]